MDKLNVHNFFKEQDKVKRNERLLEILLRLFAESYLPNNMPDTGGKE